MQGSSNFQLTLLEFFFNKITVNSWTAFYQQAVLRINRISSFPVSSLCSDHLRRLVSEKLFLCLIKNRNHFSTHSNLHPKNHGVEYSSLAHGQIASLVLLSIKLIWFSEHVILHSHDYIFKLIRSSVVFSSQQIWKTHELNVRELEVEQYEHLGKNHWVLFNTCVMKVFWSF